MLQPLSRAARWLAAASVALGGCAEVPQSSQQQLQPAAAVQKPAFDPANMKRFRTLDPDEIRRRWGDLELYMGTVFVSKGNTGDDPEFKEFRWVTPGALARVDFLYCYEKTRKCSEGWHWIQYDQEAKRLNFLRSDGVAYAHGVVQPDGMVATTLLTNGRKWESRYDYDKDEGVDQYAAGPTRYTPADRKQYAELQKQWKAVHAQTLAEEQAVAQAREAEQRAAARAREEERQAQRRREEADSAQNINRALTAFGQSYNSSMADYRRQQAQSAALNDRISRSMETSRPAPAPTRSAPTTSYAPTVASRPSIPTITPQAVRPPAPTVSTLSPAPAPAQPARTTSAPAPERTVVASAPSSTQKSRAAEEPRKKLTATMEAIMVCTKPHGPNGSFRCQSPVSSGDGSLKETNPSWRTPEAMASAATAGCKEQRRLESVTHLVWGCGFGATNNSNSLDRSAGVDVRGRRTYYCHPKETGCRRLEP